MRCSWQISPSEAPKRDDGWHHTHSCHAHATCESATRPTTIRTCLNRGAWLTGVVIPPRVLLVAARRYRPKTQKLHRARADADMFERAPCAATLAPFRREAELHGSPCRRPVIGGGILAAGPAGVPPVPVPPHRQVHCCRPCSLWWVAVTHPLRRRPPRPLWKLPRDSPPRIASSMHIAPCPPPTAHKKKHAAPVQAP